MRTLLARLGLLTALVMGTFGVVVLIAPSEASVPPALEQVARAVPELPEDRPPRARLPAVDRSQEVTLLEGTRIRVPRLRIDLPLELGDSTRDVAAQSTPADAAYLLPGSAIPGTPGNAYVYAHARPGLFLALWDVRLGDTVEVAAPSGGVLRYVVVEIHPRVAPSDLGYIAPTDDERLTLQTSTGSWVLSPRFVVVARPAW